MLLYLGNSVRKIFSQFSTCNYKFLLYWNGNSNWESYQFPSPVELSVSHYLKNVLCYLCFSVMAFVSDPDNKCTLGVAVRTLCRRTLHIGRFTRHQHRPTPEGRTLRRLQPRIDDRPLVWSSGFLRVCHSTRPAREVRPRHRHYDGLTQYWLTYLLTVCHHLMPCVYHYCHYRLVWCICLYINLHGSLWVSTIGRSVIINT